MPGKNEEDWGEIPEGVDEDAFIAEKVQQRVDDDLDAMLRDAGF